MNTVISTAFCRPDLTLRSIISIKKNFSDQDFNLKVYVDKASNSSQNYDKNRETIDILQKANSLGLITQLVEREEPYGCAKNIFFAIKEELNTNDKIFLIEDDIELMRLHKNLPEKLFNYYENENDVSCITTYSNSIKLPQKDTYLALRPCSLAWGTWKKYWEGFEIEDIKKINASSAFLNEIKSRLGSDMPAAFKAFKHEKVDSWAIPWSIYNLLKNTYTSYPKESFVEVFGHKEGATHTKNIVFNSNPAKKRLNSNNFAKKPSIDEAKFLKNYSFFSRAQRKIVSKLKL